MGQISHRSQKCKTHILGYYVLIKMTKKKKEGGLLPLMVLLSRMSFAKRKLTVADTENKILMTVY